MLTHSLWPRPGIAHFDIQIIHSPVGADSYELKYLLYCSVSTTHRDLSIENYGINLLNELGW